MSSVEERRRLIPPASPCKPDHRYCSEIVVGALVPGAAGGIVEVVVTVGPHIVEQGTPMDVYHTLGGINATHHHDNL